MAEIPLIRPFSGNRGQFVQLSNRHISRITRYALGIFVLIGLDMQQTTVYKVSKTLSCHCWNGDRTRWKSIEFDNSVEIAVASRNSKDVLIYGNCNSPRFEDWKLLHTLTGVGKRFGGLGLARLARDCVGLGPELQPHSLLLGGLQCLRVDI